MNGSFDEVAARHRVLPPAAAMGRPRPADPAYLGEEPAALPHGRLEPLTVIPTGFADIAVFFLWHLHCASQTEPNASD